MVLLQIGLVIPVDLHSVLQVLIQQEFMGHVNGEQRYARIHELTKEKAESITIELIVHMFLEMFQHPADFLFTIIHKSSCST